MQAYGSPDMVVLAIIERAHVEVGGLPPQDWALRVTLVYRREGNGWRLAHRHANPLANGITLEQSAVLARGNRLVRDKAADVRLTKRAKARPPRFAEPDRLLAAAQMPFTQHDLNVRRCVMTGMASTSIRPPR